MDNIKPIINIPYYGGWMDAASPSERWGANKTYRSTYVSKKTKNARKAQRKARKRNR